MSEVFDSYKKIEPELISFVLNQWMPRMIACGNDFNDVQRLVNSVKTWDKWLQAWIDLGNVHMEEAEKAYKAKNWGTAADYYHRASVAYHYGQFMWHGNLEEKMSTFMMASEAFKKAAPLLDPPARRFEIPWQGRTVSGYVRLPNNTRRPPLVMFTGGVDGWKEEYANFMDYFIERGIATVTFDGPGQGELLDMVVTHTNFQDAAFIVLDWTLANYPEINSEKVGVVGISMGGYYATRIAAVGGDRFQAACGIGGTFDLSDWDSRPPLLRVNIATLAGFEDWKTADEMVPQVFNLADVIDNLSCPLLTVHGDKDRIFDVAQAYKVYENVKHDNKEIKIYKGGNHVCNNMPYAYRNYVADWFAEKLNA